MVRDSVQLETAVNTISHEYLLEFTSEYGISEMLHPELSGPGDRIIDFPEGKAGEEYPQCYTKPLDSLKNWNNRFFWVDECVFPTAVDWRTNASKDGMLVNGTYSVKAVRVLDMHRTPIKKQQDMLLCLVEIDLFSLIRAPNPTKVKTESRPRAPHELPLLTLTAPRVIEMDEPAVATDSSGVPSTIERSPLDFDHEAEAFGRETVDSEMPPPEDNLLRFERAVKEVMRGLMLMLPRSVPADVSDPDPLAFADAPSPHPADVARGEKQPVTSPLSLPSPCTRRSDGVPVSVPTVVPQGLALLLVDAATQTLKMLRALMPSPGLLFALSTSPLDCGCLTDAKRCVIFSLSHQSLNGLSANCLPLSEIISPGIPKRHTILSHTNFFTCPPVIVATAFASIHFVKSSQGVVVAGDPEYENVSSPAEVGSLGSVYRPEWGVTNGSLLDTPEACQDLVDHAAPPGYFSELRHMNNEDFLGQYNINLARQVAMGSQLYLRFEQEAKLLRKSVAQVARRDQRIQARESEIKNLEALLETEAGMKRAAKEKSAGLSQELERMRAQEETLKAAFEDYKQQQDQMVEQRCAKIDARLDALSVDFDEELYPHMLTAIVGCRWVIGHGLRLAMMKCAESLEIRQAFADVVSTGVAKGMSEGLKHGVEHGYSQRTVESLEAYDPEAKAKFSAALQSLKDLKYPLLDQLEGLRDAPIDVIMAALYLESDTEGMPHNLYATSAPAPLRSPSWYIQSRIVCRTHGVGSAHHARSDRVPVSAPIVVPQVLALLLVDAATQTESGA
nr:hypothetical protein [Tanacetum cinerariifolium]